MNARSPRIHASRRLVWLLACCLPLWASAQWQSSPPLADAAFPIALLQTEAEWSGWGLHGEADATDDERAASLTHTADSVLLTPGGAEPVSYRVDIPMPRRNWLAANMLRIRYTLEGTAEDDAVRPEIRVGLTGLDTELMQTRPRWHDRGVIELPLGGEMYPRLWRRGAGHEAVWTDMWRHYVRQLQLDIRTPKGQSLRITAVELDRRLRTPPQPSVAVFGRLPYEPQVGDLFELRLTTEPLPADLYQHALRLAVTLPDGSRQELRPFLSRDYGVIMADGRETLQPRGAYHWAARLYLRQAGTYSWRLYDGDRPLADWTHELAVRPAADGQAPRGFLELAGRDGFVYENGDGFYGIGLNACYPLDARTGLGVDQALPTERPYSIYRDWFRRMRAAGINTSQIWLTPYWTALEWHGINDGYGGRGVYSPRAAWILDLLLGYARESDVRLLLTTRNHHQFWTTDEGRDPNPTQWPRNPWNAANGGPLTEPRAWFTDATARAGEAAHIGYILARWGQDPHVLAFNILSETDNTYAGGVSETPKVEGHAVPQLTLPAAREIRDWYHGQLDAAARATPQPRPIVVGNCRSREQLALEVWQDSRLPLVMNDWYVGRRDSDVGAAQIMHFAYTWTKRHGKPAWFTETGFASSGERLHETVATLHEAYWSSSMMPGVGTCMYWWWNQILAQGLEAQITPVARFWAGEDRRGLHLTHTCGFTGCSYQSDTRNGLTVTSSGDRALRAAFLSGPERAYIYLWMYADFIPYVDPIPHSYDAHVTVPGQFRDRGRPVVLEFWDTYTGEVIERRVEPLPADRRIALPHFYHDLAVKLYIAPDDPTTVATITAPALETAAPLTTLRRTAYRFDPAELPADADAALALIRQTTSTWGASGWRRIDDQHNPWSTDWPVPAHFSVYDGDITAPKTGDYAFAIDCDEAGFLWLDDQLLIAWPGNHDPTQPDDRYRSDWTQHQATVALDAGPHRIRFAVFNSAGAFLARLAWRPPGAEDFTVVPPRAFMTPEARQALQDGSRTLTPIETALWPDLQGE